MKSTPCSIFAKKIAKQIESERKKTERDDADEGENVRMTMAIIVARDLNCTGTELSCIDPVRERYLGGRDIWRER